MFLPAVQHAPLSDELYDVLSNPKPNDVVTTFGDLKPSGKGEVPGWMQVLPSEPRSIPEALHCMFQL
jgi:hypothetical protein